MNDIVSLTQMLLRKGEFPEWVLGNNDLASAILTLLVMVVALMAFYGLMMGWRGGVRQCLSSTVKVPLLFLLSLAICFPSLYVSASLLGARVTMAQTLALLLSALALNALLLACFGPICGFFAAGSDYHFMKLLHVCVFAVCASYSLGALRQGLAVTVAGAGLYPAQALRMLSVWILVYGFVGAQMAWTLRPFIGEPGLPFELLRHNKTGMNFYAAVGESMKRFRREGSQEGTAPDRP